MLILNKNIGGGSTALGSKSSAGAASEANYGGRVYGGGGSGIRGIGGGATNPAGSGAPEINNWSEWNYPGDQQA